MNLYVHYLPQFVSETDLAGSTVMVVDSASSFDHNLPCLAGRGCDGHPPAGSGRCAQQASQFGRCRRGAGRGTRGTTDRWVRSGQFPAQYTPDQVFGRTVLFTTTNGTRALLHARIAERVLVGAAVNRRLLSPRPLGGPRGSISSVRGRGASSRAKISSVPGHWSTPSCKRASPGHWQPNEWAESAHREWQELLNGAGRADVRPANNWPASCRRPRVAKICWRSAWTKTSRPVPNSIRCRWCQSWPIERPGRSAAAVRGCVTLCPGVYTCISRIFTELIS